MRRQCSVPAADASVTGSVCVAWLAFGVDLSFQAGTDSSAAASTRTADRIRARAVVEPDMQVAQRKVLFLPCQLVNTGAQSSLEPSIVTNPGCHPCLLPMSALQ